MVKLVQVRFAYECIFHAFLLDCESRVLKQFVFVLMDNPCASMDDNCEKWLLEHLPQHFDTFVKHEFTSLDAISITEDDLKDMDISIG